MKKNSNTAGLVAAVIGAYLLLANGDFGDFKLPSWGGGKVEVIDAGPLDAPTGALLDAVTPLIGAVSDAGTRAQLAALHVEMGNQIERDTDNITTVAKVREFNERVGQLYIQKFGRNLNDESPDLEKKLRAAGLKGMGGTEGGELDAAKRSQVVGVYRAVAWAFTR